MKKLLPMALLVFVSGCMPTKPIVHYASENTFAVKYSAYDTLPTVTAEAIDMAVNHCAKYGKGMKLVSSNAVNGLTTLEIHTFMCTNDFIDERIEVKITNTVERNTRRN